MKIVKPEGSSEFKPFDMTIMIENENELAFFTSLFNVPDAELLSIANRYRSCYVNEHINIKEVRTYDLYEYLSTQLKQYYN